MMHGEPYKGELRGGDHLRLPMITAGDEGPRSRNDYGGGWRDGVPKDYCGDTHSVREKRESEESASA